MNHALPNRKALLEGRPQGRLRREASPKNSLDTIRSARLSVLPMQTLRNLTSGFYFWFWFSHARGQGGVRSN